MNKRGLPDDAQRAAAGDADAVQRLIVHCHETLHRVVTQARSPALTSRIDPDDILQQAYIAAFQALCTPPESNSAPPDSDATATRDVRSNPGSAPPAFQNTAHFYKWIEAVALHRLRDAERALRRQKRDVAREISPAVSSADSYLNLTQQIAAGDATPSQQLRRAEAVAAVMSSLARLPETQRDVIRWRFLQGVPFAEIAQRLGKSEDAIYMICHRGLKGLRGLLVSITHYLTKL